MILDFCGYYVGAVSAEIQKDIIFFEVILAAQR
jgi:hypothetical protein